MSVMQIGADQGQLMALLVRLIGAAAPLSYRAPDNSTRSVRVLFSLTSALKLCPVRAATRCIAAAW